MKFDRKGATDLLGVRKCFVCEKVKSIFVVATLGDGKSKDLHFPCCSEECLEVLSEGFLRATNY